MNPHPTQDLDEALTKTAPRDHPYRPDKAEQKPAKGETDGRTGRIGKRTGRGTGRTPPVGRWLSSRHHLQLIPADHSLRAFGTNCALFSKHYNQSSEEFGWAQLIVEIKILKMK